MTVYQDKIGCFIQIPNIGRGKIRYIGPVHGKEGFFVGVDLLANIGKNDGTFGGERYFDTEYPRSGLFIQFPKVAELIEHATLSTNASRRTTMGTDFLPRQRNNTDVTNNFSSHNIDTDVVTRHGSMNMIDTMTDTSNTRSPTPMRNIRMASSFNHLQNGSVDSHNNDDRMEIDSAYSNKNAITDIVKEYELKFEKQKRTILEYEKLLNDQRVLLEEIQPVIDVCENKSQQLEHERDQLKRQLELEREQQLKQKNYFETEHEQLMGVVTNLHEEIKQNEKRVMEEKETDTYTPEEINELKKYKEDMELARIKWNKEKDQLKMHNESLSKEYQELNKELLSMSGNNDTDALNKEIESLKQQLSEANNKIQQQRAASSE